MNGARASSPWLAALALGAAQAAWSAPTALEFQRAVVALHEQQIAKQPVRTTKQERKYEGTAAARYRYVETRYFDAASGRLLARVRRDAAKPHAVHIVEVNVYDDAGRVVRDYGSIALPWAPQQPTVSIINVHRYNGQLHSFRQFNLAGQVSYESCQGELDGRRVRIGLDGEAITPQAAASPDYLACFDGVDRDARKYLNPF